MSYTKERMREYMNEWRRRRRETAFAHLGFVCVRCGESDRSKLHFDHKERHTKNESIANMWTSSVEKFYTELFKCQLLCRKCHILKTNESKDYGVYHFGEQIKSSKLKVEQVRKIRELISLGKSISSVSREYNVARSTIRKIKKGESWVKVL